ncbi:unnamed protein product [Calypogeia fissa]
MAVYFKFKSAKDFDCVSIDGHFISVANLKDKIVEQKKLGRGSDYDLVISNAQTNEEYTDEGFLVPKNTSVIVRRVPGRPSMPIVADVKDERKSSLEVPPVNSDYQILESTQKTIQQSSGPDGLDDFGIDLYAVPEVVQAPTLTDDEDSKIRAFVDSSATEWQRQTQESFAGGKGYGNKGQGRGLPPRGGYGGRGGFEKKNPPHGYVCHRCGVTGHYIQHCPTNGDPTYDMKKVKPPTGIPKTMLVANPDGSYALPTGEVAVLKPNEAVFEREVDGLPTSSRPIFDIPPELCCPLCKGVLKEAVLTSKCCFKSYCDKCIRNEIISKGKCVCGAANVLADDLLPNRTLRDAINRFLESQASAATSSGNIGSRAQLPDMESAPYARPAMSASLKEASSTMVASDGSDTNEPLAGVKDDVPNHASGSVKQGKDQSVSGTRLGNEVAAPVKQGMQVIDGSPESQLTKDTVQEMVSLKRPAKPDSDHRDEVVHLPEPVKGKKKTKGKRPRQVDMAYSEGMGMWNQGPNYNSQLQAENCCLHCGSYEHPTWNCYMMNGPGPSHHPGPMHGPMFGPGFNPQMMGMMHPMGDGYMMPYRHNPGPLSGYGVPPYELQFNGPMVPPHEPFVSPHAGMMPYRPPPPMQRDYVDPALMSREVFEARKAELKRRKEREQRFGREHVKYPSADVDIIPPPRLQGRVGPRLLSPSEIEHEGSLDLPGEERDIEVRPHRNSERRSSQTRLSRPREDWIEEEELQGASDGEGSAERDYYETPERWSSRHDDEATSGDKMSEDRRYFIGETALPTKQKGRVCTSKATGRSGQDGARLGQKRSASVYDSGDDGDLRRQSGSQVGPTSPYRALRSSESDNLRDVEYNSKDSSESRLQGGERSVKALILKERPRVSVFERTNLPIKPKRAIDSDYDAGDFREKRMKSAGSRALDSKEQVARETEDSSRQRAGIVSRKRRIKRDS